MIAMITHIMQATEADPQMVMMITHMHMGWGGWGSG